jgi:hypothetical protein
LTRISCFGTSGVTGSCQAFGPFRFADVADVGESPQNLLPGLDVGGGELFLAELRPQRIEQNGRLSCS